MPSIRKRAKSNGKLSYRADVRLKGFPPQRATFERLTDAKKWAQQTEAAIREGRYFKTTEARKHTLADAIDRYVKSILVPLKPKSIKQQKPQLEWWKQQLGHFTLADVSTPLIAERRDELLQQIGPATVVRYLAALSHVFSIAKKEWQWIDRNPVSDVTKPKEPRGRVRFLDDDERIRLLRACKDSKNEYLYAVVVLALSTGMRQSEIMNLRWPQVDMGNSRITLYETKNNETRVVPIVGHALQLIQEHSKFRRLDTDLLFPGRNPNAPVFIRAPWGDAVKAADLKNFRFHDLRHSAASYLAMNGASLAEIAEVLGHKTLSMVRRYSHLSEAHTTSVVASMNKKIFGSGS